MITVGEALVIVFYRQIPLTRGCGASYFDRVFAVVSTMPDASAFRA
jgi:hypothetical protein